ncbi:DUF4245 domain-containing protein [Raineyella sp.]|uniref:DUF4245 domain-containing protein n=1 Tax=Raineyella sp. TaxID=1911550 RepID=UPI002B206978|nr:DUF4245 domain-containing protein [Raineyella sp.]MEA5154369.1 DUF4245 domain-containing protein [Raineyella sp.]
MADPTVTPQLRVQKTRKSRTMRDMLLSLGVVMVPILLITWLYTNNLSDYPVQPVDPTPMIAQARAEAPYPVYAPVNLPTGEGGWVVTQASWVPKGASSRSGDGASSTDEWLWGGLDQSKTYYAVNESDDDPGRVIRRLSRDGSPDGTSTVEGKQWERWVSPDGRTRVLALRENGYILAVTADAPYEGLEAMASSLGTH